MPRPYDPAQPDGLPPHGFRGFASTARASRFGRVKDYHQRAHEELCILVQIETRQGLDNL